MMTPRKQNLFIGSAVALLFGVLCWISFDFMESVQQSLWDNSVKNIMESTARGANVLQRGYIKDIEMLRMLANELEQGKVIRFGTHPQQIEDIPFRYGQPFRLIFEDGTGYVDSGLAVTLTPQEMDTSRGCMRAAVCCSRTQPGDGEEDTYHLYGGGFPRRAQGIPVQGL